MSSDFTAEVVHLDCQFVLAVAGEVDVETAPHLWMRMEEAIELSPHLVLDMTAMSFMDSTGVSALVRAQRACLERDGSVTVRSPQPAVRRVLEVTMLDTLITVEG